MLDIEVIIFLLVIIVVFSVVVEKLKIPQPIMLVFVGLVIGFVPQVPDVVLSPDIVFLVFLPPLLFTAAWKLSWHSFKAERGSVFSLATGLVFFTTIAIAAVAHYFIPGFTWQLGFVLGAIISPPDAVAASAVTKGLNLNKRITTILEGESLVNDASALVAYRYAILSVVSGTFVLWEAGIQFLWLGVGGILVGLIIARCFTWAHKYLRHNSTIEVTLIFLIPFLSYVLAEHFHLSGVLASVSAGLFLSYRAPEIFTYQTRMQASSWWETIEFLLNGFVFILIGLQLPGILKHIEEGSILGALGYGVLITTVAIVVRIIWVFPGIYIPIWLSRKSKKRREMIDWRYVAIISWAGMRGVVSLASALAIPLTMADGKAFPQRDMILFITFVVIFLTLVVHGLSLRLVIKVLRISSDHTKEEQEEKVIRKHLATQALAFIDKKIINSEIDESVLQRLRSKYEINLRSVTEKEMNTSLHITANNMLLQYAKAQKEVLDFERTMLVNLHKDGVIASEVLKHLEYEMDIEESRVDEQIRRVK